MGKIKFTDISNATDPEDAEVEGGFYDGPCPPKGLYRTKLKVLRLTETGPKSQNPGSPMLKLILELQARPNKPEAKFDGYGIFHNLNVTDQGKGWVNQFLDALTDGSEEECRKIRRAFWGGEFVVDGEAKGDCVRIGSKRIDSPNGENIVYVNTFIQKYEGEDQLRVRKFLISNNVEKETPEEIENLPELPSDDTEAFDEPAPNDPWGNTDDDPGTAALDDNVDAPAYDDNEPPF